MTTRRDLHVNGQYQRKPWGYLGMTVHIYRPVAKGPARMKRLYAMRSLKGVVATARTMDALADLARREQWVARYRHVDADGREVWVTVPEREVAMGTRKTDGALEGNVDVKDAYRMAQVDVLTLVRLIAEVTSIHARCAKKAGLHFGHVGDLAELRRSLVAAVAQLAQQDEQFIWKRVAAMRRGKKT